MKLNHDQFMNHRIRMEIMMEAGTPKVPVGQIVFDLFNRAQSNGEVTFIDTAGVTITKAEFPRGQTFIERFMVSQVPTGSRKKVLVGFSMTSKLGFAEIKRAIGYSWLHEQKVFLRVQNMPFEHGIDVFLIGYLIKEHPFHMDLENSKDVVLSHWHDTFDILGPVTIDAENHDDEHPEIKELHEFLLQNDLVNESELFIPVSLEKNQVKVAGHDELKPFETSVISVYVPRAFKDAATKLNDLALTSMSTTTIIPFALQKLEPRIFHRQMTQHASYLHRHRNIVITEVEEENFEFTLNTEPIDIINIKNPEKSTVHTAHSITLKKLLAGNPEIYRVYPHPERNKLNISVEGQHYGPVSRWIETALSSFTQYYPQLKKSVRSPSTFSIDESSKETAQTDKISRYTKVNRFLDETDNSFDASTISSRPTRPNSWTNQRPPAELVFDYSEFPKMPSIHPSIKETDKHKNGDGTVQDSEKRRHTEPGIEVEDYSKGKWATQAAQRGFDPSNVIPHHSVPRSQTGYGHSSQSTPTIDNLSQSNQSVAEVSIARSIAASEAIFNQKIEKLERDRQSFEKKMFDQFSALQSAIAQLTASTTRSADQPDPTVNLAGARNNDDDTKMKMAALQRSYESTNVKMNTIQRSLDTLLHRFSLTGQNEPDPAPDESSSPPRKMLKFDAYSNADSSMEGHVVGVSDS
jgi:hypothetical protein